VTATATEYAQKHLGIPGPLTLAVFGVLWRAERPLSMGVIHNRVCDSYKPVALTTVSSTLSRLKSRGLVSKPRDGTYQAAITRNDLVIRVTSQLSMLIDDTILAIEEV